MNASLRARLSALAAAAVVLTPRLAAACSVCSAGRDDETRLAFIWTTAFLTVLPLGMLGGFFWWLLRRVRALEHRDTRPQATAEQGSGTDLASLGRASS